MNEKQNELIVEEVDGEAIPEITGEKAVLVAEEPQAPAVQSEMGSLLQMAVSKDMDVDKLEKLIQLKTQEEDRACKKEFDLHFAAMQGELPPVPKGSPVWNKNKTEILYYFCKLETILALYKPIINKHGFSYSWEEEEKADSEKRIWCTISGYGYDKKGFFDAPIQAATTFTNVIQQRGSSSSYGKRYSFSNALGVVFENVDNDGNSNIDEILKFAPELQLLKDASSLEELDLAISQTKSAWNKADKDGKKLLANMADQRKRELS